MFKFYKINVQFKDLLFILEFFKFEVGLGQIYVRIIGGN